MTPERWALLREIFREAFELPESERLHFLHSACPGDLSLQSELERLLAKLGASLKRPLSEGQAARRGEKTRRHPYLPDPMIYSQLDLISKGVAVTWDNPDIQLFDSSGTAVPSYSLAPGTRYEIQARVWNGSANVTAIAVRVRFFYLTFGAGTLRNYIGETYVDVPVQGSPLEPARASVAWITPSAGHYCIQVELSSILDADSFNNLGQENVDVRKLNASQATLSFPVRNTSAGNQRFTLRLDSYAICGRFPYPYEHHRPALSPLPDGWTVRVAGGRERILGPGEQQDVSVEITAAAGFVGTQPINVNVLNDAGPVGGVTLYVHS